MRSPTPRELALQNLLAMGATLLFRSAEAMRGGNRATQLGLVIECEAWFSEARDTLSRAIHSEGGAASHTPVPPAPSSGVAWNSPREGITTSSPGPAQPTEAPPSPEETPSPLSLGGGGKTASLEAEKKSSTSSPLDWFLL